MEVENLIERVQAQIGKPAATAVAIEDPTERHFIGEAALAGVALYVLGKYLDGFVEGLGVKKLGEEHAEFALLTLAHATDLSASKMKTVAGKVHEFVCSLLPHKRNVDAVARAQQLVIRELTQDGVPEHESRLIAEGITREVFCDG